MAEALQVHDASLTKPEACDNVAVTSYSADEYDAIILACKKIMARLGTVLHVQYVSTGQGFPSFQWFCCVQILNITAVIFVNKLHRLDYMVMYVAPVEELAFHPNSQGISSNQNMVIAVHH